jgi:hypothetical protein
MTMDANCDDAAQIIRGLTTLPGGISVQVIAKRFPRLGPAEPGTGYMQKQQCFELNHLPDDLPIPPGMDEILITMEGALDQAQSTLNLLSQVNDFLGAVSTTTCWDARTFFGNPMESPRSYRIELFPDLFSGRPSA